jgi:hypothetical protein
MSALGDALAVIALALIVFVGWLAWRQPFLGLGVLVAGMAFHNVLIMVLLRLGTAAVLIRVVQSWKEGILALLVLIAGLRLWRMHREGRLGRPAALDWIAGIYVAIMLLYLVLPSGLLHGASTFGQRLSAFRLAIYIPVLYALGRSFGRPTSTEIARVAWIVLGAGAVVGAFGLYELWFVPTTTWRDWGVNLFSAWLGFQYHGPGHMPENFFQTLPSGLYLRRMVSTYLSPLGIAYTGLLVFPIGAVLLDRIPRRTTASYVAGLALVLLVAGVLFSVTRLAMFVLIGEATLLIIIMRRRWVTVMAPVLVAAVFGVIAIYPQYGPAVDLNLVPGGPNRGSLLSLGDPSLQEHFSTLSADIKVFAKHPLGEGFGSSGSSANRFGAGTPNPGYAPGESAILTMFVDTGVLGGLAYLALYLFGLYRAGRALLTVPRGSLELALPMAAFVGGLALIPISLTNDVWGDLSVLFLFWWAVGYSAGLAGRTAVPKPERVAARRRTVASS